MGIRVVYTTRCKGEQTLGKQVESYFASIEAARSAPIPAGCESAFVPVENGYHAYSRALGWEFAPK